MAMADWCLIDPGVFEDNSPGNSSTVHASVRL